jgi:two-component system cell cycle response regulator
MNDFTKSADFFERLFEKSENLPTLPGIALQLLQTVQKENPDIDEIGKILATDPPLSAKVLKIVNSAFYSLPTRITSVKHAIMMLGINSVKNLALSFSLVNKFKSHRSKILEYSLFWKDSLIGAIAVKLMGEKIIKSFSDSDDIFFMGLLQNIGFLTLSLCMPRQYDLVMVESVKNGAPVHEVESQILGFNHMEIGEYLIKLWGLPDTFYTPIGYHHYPQKLTSARDDIHTLTEVLHLSSLYIELFNHSCDVSLKLSEIQQKVKACGFDEAIDIHEVGKAINQKASGILPIFEIEFEDENEYAQLLQTAKAQMATLSSELINNLLDQRQEINLLRQQVGRDSMTSLNNHQRFRELLEQEISRSERYKHPLSVIFADIDEFKSINDTYGHLAGDRAIKIIAGCLEKELRQSDHLARYGGEEFAVILPEAVEVDAWMVAERLRETINSLRIAHEDGFIHVTMSFGIVTLKSGEKISLDELIRRADTALYIAKNQGRNQCCVFDMCN